jgi:hypothetical protein
MRTRNWNWYTGEKRNKFYCTKLPCVKFGFFYQRCKAQYLNVFWKVGIRKEGTLTGNERGGLTKRYEKKKKGVEYKNLTLGWENEEPGREELG